MLEESAHVIRKERRIESAELAREYAAGRGQQRHARTSRQSPEPRHPPYPRPKPMTPLVPLAAGIYIGGGVVLVILIIVIIFLFLR
jgi:hypothetical protein